METSEPLLHEAGARSEYLRPRDLVELAERYLSSEDAGVPREAVLDHVEALGAESHVDEEAFRAALADAVTDASTWVNDRAVYAVGGDRLSAYPPAWHEALKGETALPAVVRYLLDETEYGAVNAGAGDGVPEADLLDIAAALTPLSREAAKGALESCRDEGTLIEDADQHPEANVYLPRSDQEQDVK